MEKKNDSIPSFLAIVFALVLMGAGLLLGIQELEKTRQMVLASQDSQLLKVAQSVDNNITGHFLWYCSDLIYLTGRQGVLNAERTWRETGDASSLLSHLSDTPLSRESAITGLVIYREGEVALSSSGRLDYQFYKRLGQTAEGVEVDVCVDGDGRHYLALCVEREGIGYAALMAMERFFETTEEQSAAGPHDRLLLLDAKGTLFCHRDAGGIHVVSVEELEPDKREMMGLSYLLEAEGEKKPEISFFDIYDEEADRTFTARLAILPASCNTNGCFAVGLINDYDETSQPVQRAVFRTSVWFMMVAAGAVLLIALLVNLRRRGLRAEEELVLLREKKDAMEKLNEKTMELAHHQRLETIGTLTSSISHEFNNLLTPIMGYSLMTLEELPPDSGLYDNVLEIYNSSQRAKTIISRLSDLSRKNSALTFRTVSPDEQVKKVLAVTQAVQPPKVEVRTDLTCGGTLFTCNEIQVAQMLLNLVMNAFQAMEDAGGRVDVATAVVGEEVVFTVADTGPGIPEDVLPHIFEPFYTTKGSSRGTGLGLAIVWQVVEDHKGTISVDSQPGKGAVFSVRIPLHREEPPMEE